MKKPESLIFVILASIVVIALSSLLSLKASAINPNCSTTVGNVTIECYGSTSSLCMTIHDELGATECYGTKRAIFHPDDPE